MPGPRPSQDALVTRLLREKTYPEGLRLDVTREEDWFPWFVASSLFAKPISADTARRTAAFLFARGVRSPEAVERCGWEGLVAILDAGGYVRYDFSTADKLLGIAAALGRGRLARLASRSAAEVERELTGLKGVGPKTVQIFLRELRGVWRADPPLSEETRSAAKRLGLDLRRVRLRARDLSRLESVLARIWIEHCRRGRWATCPAGGRCGCASKARNNP